MPGNQLFIMLLLLGALIAIFAYDWYRGRQETRRRRRSLSEPGTRGLYAGLEIPRPGNLDRGRLPVPQVTPTASDFSAPRGRAPWVFNPARGSYKTELPESASKGEKECALAVANAFPGARVLYHYRDRELAVNPETGRALEFDFLLPDLRLAIEYNGRQHYEPSGFEGDWRSQQARDAIKAGMAYEAGVTLVVVPYVIKTPEEIRQRVTGAVLD